MMAALEEWRWTMTQSNIPRACKLLLFMLRVRTSSEPYLLILCFPLCDFLEQGRLHTNIYSGLLAFPFSYPFSSVHHPLIATHSFICFTSKFLDLIAVFHFVQLVRITLLLGPL